MQAEAAENVELENLEQQAPAARNGELQNISGAVRDLTGDDGQYGPDLQPQSTYGLPGNNFSSLDHTFPVHLFYQLYMQETSNLNITGLVH